MKEKIQLCRPAAAAFLTMMAMALTSSTLSFFLEPVCRELGISRGSFSLIFSLMTIAGALTNPVLGQRAGRKGVRGILLVCGVWGCGSLLLFSAARQLWMVYAAGFLMGLFGTNCVALCANVMVQKAYDPGRAASILGLVMAGSGVGGMIFNILIPGVMAAAGWRSAMVVMAVVWMGLLLLGAILLGREKPAEQHTAAAGIGLGMTRAEALKRAKLYLLILIIVIITAACGVQQQQPSLLASYGFENSRVSLLLSAQTAVLALGKIGQGMLYGRLGVRRGGCMTLLIFAAAFGALLIPELVYPGLVLMAIGLGIYTTLLPLVTRQLFGTREYGAIWGLLATCGSLGTIVANPLWGSVYDLWGSYAPAMIVCAVLLVGAAFVLNKLLKELR
ncbi:MAG: MFS transporter [Ruminococcaceae bacterium]|nr:MFS transporter [Oscillospiraceae bacterium]